MVHQVSFRGDYEPREDFNQKHSALEQQVQSMRPQPRYLDTPDVELAQLERSDSHMNRDGQTPVFDIDNYEKMSKIRARLDERQRSSL